MMTNPFITELIRLLRLLSFSDDAVVLNAARSANALVESNGYVWEEVLDDSLRYEDVPQETNTSPRKSDDPATAILYCSLFSKQFLPLTPEEEATFERINVRFAGGYELTEIELEWLDEMFHRTLDADH